MRQKVGQTQKLGEGKLTLGCRGSDADDVVVVAFVVGITWSGCGKASGFGVGVGDGVGVDHGGCAG